jgi:hypothetical protein
MPILYVTAMGILKLLSVSTTVGNNLNPVYNPTPFE